MNLVVVTSAIQVPGNSVFSPEQRFLQMMNTLHSARTKIPDAYVVVVDTGTLSPDQIQGYKQFADEVHCMNSTHLVKNLGEATMLFQYFSSDAFGAIKPRLRSISKLSGRYFLNDWFYFERYPIEIPLIQHRIGDVGEHLFETRYYRFPIEYFDTYYSRFRHLMTEGIHQLDYDDVEHLFFKEKVFTLENSLHDQRLGVSGWYAGSGKYVED